MDRAADVALAHGQRAVEPGGVARGRLEALQRGRQRLALAVEPLARGAEKQLQVAARVRVQRGQDLVEVDVGQRLVDRDGAALRRLARRARARVELDDHVVQAGLGAQQRRGVLVDRRVLAPDLHRHHRAPVDEVHLGDVADVDARHLDRLALARRHRLRGGELGLVVDEVRADDRDPLGQVEALVGEDVAAHEQCHQHDADDEGEVARVLADRHPHRTRPAPRRRARRRRAARGGAVEVGQRVLVTGERGVVRRALARVGRPRPQRRRDRVGEDLVGGCRPTGPSTASGRRRRAGSGRTGRCRRSPGPRRRGRPSSTRTPCSSPRWSRTGRRRSSRHRSAGRRSSRTWPTRSACGSNCRVASTTLARSSVAGLS